MTTSERIAAILNALRFTPEQLSEKMNISICRARLMLEGKVKIFPADYVAVLKLTGIYPDVLKEILR